MAGRLMRDADFRPVLRYGTALGAGGSPSGPLLHRLHDPTGQRRRRADW
jgi:hypothetical protein